MDILRKGLTFVLAVLFVISATAALLLFNLEQKVFSASVYQQAFANDQFYDRLPTLMAKALSASLDQSELPTIMQSLSTQNWENLIRALMPPEMLKTIGDDILRSFFAYLNSESNTAQVSLAPFKERMAADAGTQAVLDFMSGLPACTLVEATQMATAILNNEPITLCNPPTEVLFIVKPLIQRQLQVAAAALPDQLVLVGSSTANQQNDPRTGLSMLRLLTRLSPVVPFVCLIILTMLAVRSLRGWLGWWGAPLLVTGVLGAASGFAGTQLVGIFVQRMLISRMPAQLSGIVVEHSAQLASAIAQELLKPVLIQGLILAGIGLVMVGIALALKSNTKTQPA